MIRIVAASHFFHRPHDDEPLTELDERVAAVTSEHYRRTDRFVQLALLGAGECAAGHELGSDCGLYMSSGVGPIGSNMLVQNAIQQAHQLPMPFNFVNTLGSSACYHVCKNLDITGEVALVARGGGSFSAALACAVADLISHVASRALVGAVEECIVPSARHRAVLRVGREITPAEGSHWLLIERGDASGAIVEDAQLDDSDYDGYDSRDASRLTGFLCRQPGTRFGLTWDGTVPGSLVQLA